MRFTKCMPIVAGIEQLNDRLHTDPFLGQGRITVSKIECQTPSINAVPDECTIYIDRRLTFGETKEQAIAQVEALIPENQRNHIRVEMLHYDTPSYTGFVFPVEKYFPAWALERGPPFGAGRPEGGADALGRNAEGRQAELFDQRHLLDGQGQHPDHHLCGRGRNHRSRRA